jgi:fructose-1,6-bisphosphatase/inositol monophosphatase family enzyme
MDSLVNKVAELMRETSDELIMPRYKTLNDSQINQKTGPKDLVTIADIESERRLTPALKSLLPGSKVVGEEAVSENPKILCELDGDGAVWLVDPVDGTNNFARGERYFCVMVGLIKKNEIILGVILDPIGGYWVGAEKNAGAYRVEFNGLKSDRLNVLSPLPLDQMFGSLNFGFTNPQDRKLVRARALEIFKGHHRHGCSGHEYLDLVLGKSYFSTHIKNMPWDHVAGCAIHTEAGGYHARFNGEVYNPKVQNGGLLAAPTKESWTEISNRLLAGIQ